MTSLVFPPLFGVVMRTRLRRLVAAVGPVLLLTAPASAEDVVPQEYEGARLAALLEDACFEGNPVSFHRSAEEWLVGIEGWARQGDDPATYTSKGGGVAVTIDERAMAASCEVTIAQGVYPDDFDMMAALQAMVDDRAGAPTDPTYDGEAFVWIYGDRMGVSDLTYTLSIVSNAGVRLSWSAE